MFRATAPPPPPSVQLSLPFLLNGAYDQHRAFLLCIGVPIKRMPPSWSGHCLAHTLQLSSTLPSSSKLHFYRNGFPPSIFPAEPYSPTEEVCTKVPIACKITLKVSSLGLPLPILCGALDAARAAQLLGNVYGQGVVMSFGYVLSHQGGVPCAVRALCTRCAKSWLFSTTGSSVSSQD